MIYIKYFIYIYSKYIQRMQTKEESKNESFEKWACDLNGEFLKKVNTKIKQYLQKKVHNF